jgi:diacylglycerol kinase (ATP)
MNSLENRWKRTTIFYNPVARGLLRREHSLQRSIAELAARGIAAELVPTTGPGSAGEQARRAIEAGCDLIIAAGGDGTINEVANGMLKSDVPLAILPGGTANVLARETRLPRNIEKAAAQIPQLLPVRVAAGRLHFPDRPERLFLCMAGAGLDAEIVSRLNLDLKAVAGKLAYYVCGFGQIFRPLSEFDVIVDGRTFPASFALLSRVRNYGGDLEIARGASLLRDDFEIVLFRGTRSLEYLRYLAGVVARRTHRLRGCTILRGSSVSCRLPEETVQTDIYVQVDGELSGKLPVTAEVVPNAITLLVPQSYWAREQQFVSASAPA